MSPKTMLIFTASLATVDAFGAKQREALFASVDRHQPHDAGDHGTTPEPMEPRTSRSSASYSSSSYTSGAAVDWRDMFRPAAGLPTNTPGCTQPGEYDCPMWKYEPFGNSWACWPSSGDWCSSWRSNCNWFEKLFYPCKSDYVNDDSVDDGAIVA